MRVFVTGASGLVGTHLLEALRVRGDEVIALSRSARSGPGVEWVRGDENDASRWWDAVDGCDAVVNLAGASVARRWTLPRMHEIVRSRVGITTALFHAIGHAGDRPRVMVSASAVGYYGTDTEATFDESSPRGDGFLADVCGEWEKAAVRSEVRGVRVVRLRIGTVLARAGGALPALARPVRAFVGGALGSGRQWTSWIHVDDLIGLIRLALDDAGLRDAVNAVAPAPVQQGDLVRAIGRVLGRPVWLDAPALVLKAGLGRMAEEMLLHGQRVVPARALAAGFEYRFADLESALRDLLL